jgi:outer membrane protein OmpA-like peptidoglycan-associated protein
VKSTVRLTPTISFLLVLAAATPLRAQEPASIPAERLRPAMDREGLIDVEWGGVGEHLDYDLGLWMGYALNPLVVYRRDDDGRMERVGSLIGHRVGASLVGGVALFEWVKLGLELPLVLYQGRGGPVDPADVALGDLSAIGVGDLQLRPKIRILRAEDQFVDLAIMPTVSVPTGFPQDNYLGEGSITVAPELALSRAFGAMRLAGNLGYRWRPETTLASLTVGQELFYRLGFGFRLEELTALPLELAATLNGATAATSPFQDLNESPLELMGGVTYDVWGPLQVFGGAGAGLAAGYATPDLRVFAGVRFSPRVRDRDGDGVTDDLDLCPDQPEDVDGFRDTDGCPDPDNDKDGVLDAEDRCPTTPGEAESYGCPSDDLDGDGIPNDDDACPEEPGARVFEGCPDTDGDGVPDREDDCPEVAGPADNKGCPVEVIDSDADGIPDEDDACPKISGVAEHQGCPDSDGDGIPDNTDQCPLERETVNQIEDEDGCPDEVRRTVKVVKRQIEIGDKVYFDVDKARIQRRSYKLLTQVADVLKENPHIELVRIEGHTDDQGPDDYNLKLSQRRADAVRDFLMKKGVEGERLVAVGFGETQPVADNETRDGREQNRRVEFEIARIAGE